MCTHMWYPYVNFERNRPKMAGIALNTSEESEAAADMFAVVVTVVVLG